MGPFALRDLPYDLLPDALIVGVSTRPIRPFRKVSPSDRPYSSGIAATPHPSWRPYISRRLSDMWMREPAAGYPTRLTLNRAWRTALRIFDEATPTPSVVPGDDGSVQFVWHRNGWDVEFEVNEEGAEVWARQRMTGETWHGELEASRDRFVALLRSL